MNIFDAFAELKVLSNVDNKSIAVVYINIAVVYINITDKVFESYIIVNILIVSSRYIVLV